MAKSADKSKYVLLADHINKEYGNPGAHTESSPMVKYFRIILSEDQAELALHVSKTPEPAELIAPRLGRGDIKALDEELWQLCMQGVMYCEFAKNDKRFYRTPNWAPGIVEYMVRNMPKYEGVAECFDEYSQATGGEVMLMSPNAGGMRVIPVMKEIAAQPRALSYEQVLKYLDQVFYAPDDVKHEHPLPPLYSLADCACRTSKKMIGEGCEHPIKDMCIQIGPEAEYYIRTGKGRQATREEVLQTLKLAEESGCVHEIFEFSFAERPVGESIFVCNCCGCSCGVLSGNFKFGGNGGTASNYLPVVDPEKCVACGACVEKCPGNAIRLGDRLCVDAKRQVEIYETADRYKWGEDKWNLNYRDRIMTTESGTSPCKTICPAHIAVQGYIRKAAEEDYAGALEVIKRENPFPAVCGRICPHPCEAECSRGAIDEAVAIDEIKRFIAEKDMEAENRFIPKIMEDNPKKIAVIGGGPSGLTCAYYLAVRGYKVTVFEKHKTLGGMLTRGIPNFRLDNAVINSEIDVIRELGVQFRTGCEVGKDVTIAQLRSEGFEAFYVAIGAQQGSLPGVEGQDAQGVITGVDFLGAVNGGGCPLSGNVVVVGGGNVAIDVARSAIRAGGERVSLFCLESAEEMPALPEEQAEARGEGVSINNGWGPKRILVEDGKVTGVEFKRCVSVYDTEHRFAPVYDENDVQTIPADHVLLAIGQRIELGGLFTGEAVETDNRGRIKVAPLTYQTSVPDIFAGGDVVTGPKFAIDAIAMGKQGCESVWRYVEGRNLTYGRQRDYYGINKDLLKAKGFDTAPRQKPVLVDPLEARHSFQDLRKGLTEEQIQREAERCLGCGQAIVDPKKCIGCGVCTVQCKFDAVHLVFDHEHKPPKSKLGWMAGLAKHAVARSVRATANEVGKNFGLDPVSRAKKERARMDQ